jgi:tripartite-type tricarboxylate transporter receptor subunit TctC
VVSIRHAIVLGAAMCALQPAAQAAEDWPARPVRFIIPFPPGGSNDIIGRLLAMHLGERLGKGFVVDNRSGAGGNLGIELAAKSNPDGYTMLIFRRPSRSGPRCTRSCPTIR